MTTPTITLTYDTRSPLVQQVDLFNGDSVDIRACIINDGGRSLFTFPDGASAELWISTNTNNEFYTIPAVCVGSYIIARTDPAITDALPSNAVRAWFIWREIDGTRHTRLPLTMRRHYTPAGGEPLPEPTRRYATIDDVSTLSDALNARIDDTNRSVATVDTTAQGAVSTAGNALEQADLAVQQANIATTLALNAERATSYDVVTITPNARCEYELVNRACNRITIPFDVSECNIVLPFTQRRPGDDSLPAMDVVLLYEGHGVRPTITPSCTILTSTSQPLSSWADLFDTHMVMMTFTTLTTTDDTPVVYASIQEVTT